MIVTARLCMQVGGLLQQNQSYSMPKVLHVQEMRCCLLAHLEQPEALIDKRTAALTSEHT